MLATSYARATYGYTYLLTYLSIPTLTNLNLPYSTLIPKTDFIFVVTTPNIQCRRDGPWCSGPLQANPTSTPLGKVNRSTGSRFACERRSPSYPSTRSKWIYDITKCRMSDASRRLINTGSTFIQFLLAIRTLQFLPSNSQIQSTTLFLYFLSSFG